MEPQQDTYTDWRGQEQPIAMATLNGRRIVHAEEIAAGLYWCKFDQHHGAFANIDEIHATIHDPNPTVERVGSFLDRHSTLLVAAGTLLFVGIPAIAWLYTNGLGWGQ